jgi:NADPH-dependent glutamate synthase beta subunit-like oxidoreductase
VAEGRNYKPIIEAGQCQTCQVCLRRCPAELIPEYHEEETSLRGLIYQREIGSIRQPGPPQQPACQLACPVHQDTRGYAALIARRKYREALYLIRQTNPLPAICGYICHHPCEEACFREGVDHPLPLRQMKRLVAEWGYQQGPLKPPRLKIKKEKVLVVGSGPAGLAAAHDLRILGYQVTVYEALPVLGGMLAVGIPAFRLPRAILQKEIGWIQSLGVEMRTQNTFPLDDLKIFTKKSGFQAAFLAIGAHASRRLFIPGEKLPGVFWGVELLRKINLGKKIVIGNRVIILGGGNVAVDAARSVLRLGAKKVTIIYRRSQKEMPAIPEEVEAAKREGIDFHFLAAPVAISKYKGDGLILKGLKVRLGAPDDTGRRTPVSIAGSEFSVSADSIVSAVGQRVDSGTVADLEVNPDGTLWADPETGQTSLKGVFAGGDGVSGPGWAIFAIAAGKRGAESIRRFLS